MRMLPPNSVCDGELVAWSGDRLSFDLLQQRLAAGAARARALAAEHPASYVVFDLLAANGVDLRGRRFDDRRAQLQTLTTWSPPMQLSPITDDLDTAKNWLAKYAAAGIEGVVAKGAATTYRRRRPRLAEIQAPNDRGSSDRGRDRAGHPTGKHRRRPLHPQRAAGHRRAQRAAVPGSVCFPGGGSGSQQGRGIPGRTPSSPADSATAGTGSASPRWNPLWSPSSRQTPPGRPVCGGTVSGTSGTDPNWILTMCL